MMKCGECGAVVETEDTGLHREWHRELMKAIMICSNIYDDDKIEELVVPMLDKLEFKSVGY